MNRYFDEPKLFAEARKGGRGLKWVLEILVLIAVTIVAMSIESIPVTIATFMNFFIDPDIILSAIGTASEGNYSILAIIDAALEAVDKVPEWITVVSLFSTALMTLIVILFCRVIQKRGAKSMGLRMNGFWKEYLLGGLFGVVMLAVAVGLGLVSGTMRISIAENFSFILIIIYLAGYIVQGMSEEVLCRGYFMTSFARKNPLWLAVIINSVYFGLLHFANTGFGILPFINLTLTGLVFSCYMIKRGNIWGVCAMHSMWNFFQGNIFGFAVSGSNLTASIFRVTQVNGGNLFNGGTFGIEGGLWDTIVELLALGFIIFILPQKNDEFR